MKKKIKIWFDGMDGNFRPEDNFILNVLKKRYIVELNENPDVVFISVKTKNPYKYNCVRIFYTAENLVPDFNVCDYGIGFHYMNFGDRYIRFPLYLVDGFKAYEGDNYASDLQLALHKHENAGRRQKKQIFVHSYIPMHRLRHAVKKCLKHFHGTSKFHPVGVIKIILVVPLMIS